jgi:hypothetical protein
MKECCVVVALLVISVITATGLGTATAQAQAQTELEATQQQAEADLISTINSVNCSVLMETFGSESMTSDRQLAFMVSEEPAVLAVLQRTAQGRCHKQKGAADFSTRLARAMTTVSKVPETTTAQSTNTAAVVSKPSQISRPTPFGFKPGMTKEQIMAAVGSSHVLVDNRNALALGAAPNPNGNFERYIVLFSPSGLGKVDGIVTVSANRSGEQVIEKYSEIKAALTQKYGKPEKDYNFVHAGALFSEPNEFMMSLLQGERTLACHWSLDDRTSIFLQAEGFNSQSAHITLSYEFHPEFDTYEKEKESPY